MIAIKANKTITTMIIVPVLEDPPGSSWSGLALPPTLIVNL